MLMNRVMGALTFKRQVYADVEKDTSFTGTAWGIVVVLALLTQLATYAASEDITSWLIASVIGTVIAVIAFAVGAFVITWLGKALFKADATFDEMVRTLGLAYVWNVVAALGALSFFVPALGCVIGPATCIASILGLVSYFIATQEALDLDTGKTLITVIAGWVVTFLIVFSATFIVGILGFGVSAIGGALTQ